MKIVVISGSICSGKTGLAENISEKFNTHIVKTRNILEAKNLASSDRLSLQKKGDKLDRNTNGTWVRDELQDAINKNDKKTIFVVDSVRIKKQIYGIRQSFGPIIHLHLTAPTNELERRYSKKYKTVKNMPSYDKVRQNKTEKDIESLADIADIVIDTNRCTKTDILIRAISHLSLYNTNTPKCVDVLVGGQYGSEGKGQIAAHISKEYDLIVRVGGPNAGHKVFGDPPITHHHLPSGTTKSNAKLLLGPGMVINVKNLQKEIADNGVSYERLKIDPQAMIIESNDVEKEKKLVDRIGSTGSGVGSATSRKILRDTNVKLAKMIKELKPYIKPAIEVLEETIANNGKILLEGTQGTGLSIHHGEYPHVTSRETTVSGCLADAGISPLLVRKIIMVVRTYPIRVQDPLGSTSGRMSKELKFKDISDRSGISENEIKKTEMTSTTNKPRRIGEFDWDLIKKSALLNRVTDIALTFVDYISITNRSAHRFEQLTQEAINMIEEIEQVTKSDVSLISTGFNSRSIIDRRKW